MFENLHAFLQVESNPLEKQRFVHINSTVEGSGFANSSFLIHYFISSFIKQGHKVLLVSCLHTHAQYKIVEHKMGVNLEQATRLGNFSFLSLLDLWSDLYTGSPDEGKEKMVCSRIMEELSSRLDDSQETLGQPFLIIFDDLTALLHLGVEMVDILNMISRVKFLYPNTFTTYVTSTSQYAELSDSGALSNQLTHWSDLKFDVNQLSTGLSKEVHGQLKISRRIDIAAPHAPRVYHYKVTERDLKLFAVGESPAVL
ncbi:elongator complex protein 6-like [Watersipora subatra]|uniref:elongator complex protein 6-like n=1 Tax=Watersipora subatra TaxID=2589382 RepID=UPI00355B02B4